MRPRKFSPALLVFILVLIGFGLWLFLQPTTTAPAKTAATATPTKIDSVRLVAAPTQVEPPKLSAVTPKPETAPMATSTYADPQTDLKTAIPDLARLAEAGDWAVIDENYYPPGSIDSSIIQRTRAQQQQAAMVAAQNPKLQQQMQQTHQAAARSWAALEAQTPTYNATGDEATYMYSVELGGGQILPPRPQTFVKINGKWYVKPPEVKGTLIVLGQNPNN